MMITSRDSISKSSAGLFLKFYDTELAQWCKVF